MKTQTTNNQECKKSHLSLTEIDEIVNKWIEDWKNDYLSPKSIQKAWHAWLSVTANNLGEIRFWGDARSEIELLGESFVTVLKRFIFNGYPSDYADQMSKREESATCGKVTSSTNYFYKCVDCEITNAKRVLCAECFMGSEHRRHNYMMYRSSTLYCCCGESETWEKPWYCAKHPVPTHRKKDESLSTRDLESRARIVMQAILLQADGLLLDHSKIQTNFDGEDDEFCAVLFTKPNKSPPIEKLLKNVIKYSTQQAHQIHKRLYREGQITFKLPRIHCKALKANVAKDNLPCQVLVLHNREVINLEFAFKMLQFLPECFKYGENLRTIFTEVITTPISGSDLSVAEKIVMRTGLLPIVYQDYWRNLLILGTMGQYNTKKALAKRFMERYDLFMDINDLNDEKLWDFLVLTSRQLLGVSKLSHDLIANQNGLCVVINSLLHENISNCIAWKDATRDWENNAYVEVRSHLHVRNIIMLLLEVPKIWTKELRSGFLKGLSCFLRMLANFQGVDSETRESDLHVEYERNNNPVLLMHKELAQCASLFIKWCRSDDEVLAVAYSETMKLFHQKIDCNFGLERTFELMNYNALCLPYDAETQPVSICLPLSRFLVALHLIYNDSLSTSIFPSKIFHPVLNLQVMCAQVKAGMWRRNGRPVRLSIHEYHDYNGLRESFDRDIQLLQIVSATTAPNKFLIQLLAKYDLVNWANRNFEENVADDEMVNVICLSEQFLQLLITVLIERYAPDVSYVTDKERIRHEIIHRLCIKPSSRSSLELYFDYEFLRDTDFEALLTDVATFKKPTSVGKFGKYELRTEFFDRYNALFYHFTPFEMSEAREFQRERLKAAKEPDCFPPSALPKLKEFFEPMVGIFQCDVMFHIMWTVLERACELTSSSYSETLLQNVLYLIGYALQEQKSGNYSALSFTEKAAKWKILDGLEKVSTIHRRDVPQDLLKWTIRTYKEVVGESETAPNEVSVLEENENLRRSKLAAARRAKIMEDMLNKQKQFMKNNSEAEPKNPVNLVSDEESSSEKVCIICQESQILDPKNEVMVTPGYVQHSMVLCASRNNVSRLVDYPLLTTNRGPALYTSSCGHIMHLRCFKIYLHKLWTDERMRSPTDHSSGFDVEKKEFICPLCECLSDVVLPLIPPTRDLVEFSNQLLITIYEFTDKLQMSNFKSALMVWKSLAYTIEIVETLLQDSNKPLLGHLSSRHHACLENFVKIAQVATFIYPRSNSTTSYFVRDLQSTLKGLSITYLSADLFNVWVAITLSESNPPPILFRSVLVAKIVQILLTAKFSDVVDDVNHDDRTPFKRILHLLRETGLSHLSENFLWNYVQKACLPFLRCCVIFHSFVSGAPHPDSLAQAGGDTFSNMCSYLGLPQDREELFHERDVYPIVTSWFQHDGLLSPNTFAATDPFHTKQLVKLPYEYCDLSVKASEFKCGPASESLVCLICGAIFCWKNCCVELIDKKFYSPLDLHSRRCNDKLYFVLKTNEIMIIPRNSQFKSIAGPYMDSYFDRDRRMQRAKALYLSSDKYKQLNTLWLSHGLFEEISRLYRKKNLQE